MPHDSRGGQPAKVGAPGYFAVDPKTGHEITRQSTCIVCKAEFTQRILSERFMLAVEKRGARAMAVLRNQIPDLWCPVYCPPCERMGLDHDGREAERRGAA